MRPLLAQRRAVRFPSSVSHTGVLRFLVMKRAVDAAAMMRIRQRLIRDADRKVFLILDTLNVHKAAKVRDWVAEHADEITLFYLPPYAPERNPDEYLHGDLSG